MICLYYFNGLKIDKCYSVGPTDKSKIIHFGFNNNESSYVLGTSTLCTVDEERDLGVIIDKTLKPSKQCAKVAGAGQG